MSTLKKLILILMMAFVCVTMVSLPAKATMMGMGPLGDPIIGGSWSQWWYTNFSFEIDTIEAFITSGNTDFVDPGMRDFKIADITPVLDWSAELINPDYSIATGPGYTGYRSFYMDYTADVSEPFALATLLWNDGDFLGGFSWEWTGSNWDPTSRNAFDITDPAGFDRTPVPEPSTLLLIGTGLMGVAGFRRKFRR